MGFVSAAQSREYALTGLRENVRSSIAKAFDEGAVRTEIEVGDCDLDMLNELVAELEGGDLGYRAYLARPFDPWGMPSDKQMDLRISW